jgi:hypothetical protein
MKFGIGIVLALIFCAIVYIYVKIGNAVIKYAGIFILTIIFVILLIVLFFKIKGYLVGITI